MNLYKAIQKIVREHSVYLLIIGCFALLGSLPFFHEGLYTAHDIWHQVARIFHYTQAIKDGQLFPTWISTLSQGHGYPLFIFSYHMPWIVGTPLALLGIDIQLVLKILFVSSFYASGVALYAVAWHLTKHKIAATTAAILYLFAPYHFLTMYVSAAIGTQFQFVVLPLLFLGASWILDKKPRIGVLLLALTTAAGILSHLITFAFMFFALILYVCYSFKFTNIPQHRKRKVIVLLVYSIFLGLLLVSFYLIPFVAYKDAIIASLPGNGFTDIYKSNFVTLMQLLYSKWGFGPIISNAKDGEISLQVGIAQWIAVATTIGIAFIALLKKKKVNTQAFFFTTLFIASIFGMMEISKKLWEVTTRFVAFDYPFRLLIIAVFAGSILSALAIAAFKKYKYLPITLALVLVVIAGYTNRNHIRVNLYTDVETSLYVRSETTTNTFHEYLPKGANSQLLSKDADSIITAPDASVSATNIKQSTDTLLFDASVSADSDVAFRQFSFPGQTLYVDGIYTNHTVDEKGRMQTKLTKGMHSILIQFEDTTPILLGKVLTVLGILFVVRFVMRESKKE